MTDNKVAMMSKIVRMAFTPQTLRQMYVWNLNRLVQEHGQKEGEKRMRDLPMLEAVRLWQTEGPGKLDLN
jgi:hypothetical protein